jgi:transposase
LRVKELEEENASLRSVIILKDAKIAQFESKVKELTERLNKNSSNSHKPPSSDGYGKKPAFPKSKGGKQGGQVGHKGGTLLMESNPDVTQPLIPLVCDCGHDISNEPLIVGEQRQVHDIPRPKKEVVAFQQYNVQCPCCGKVNKGQFPAGVNSAVQYGTRIRTLSVLLNTDYKIPVKKISSLLGDLYGITPNEGSIMSNNRRCYEILEPVEHRIKEEIKSSAVAHSDETGVRVEGKLHWLHTTSTLMYTYFYIHAKRGSDAITDACSIIADYPGRLIHDCYESYFKLTKAKHGLCGAHLLRELASQIDDKKAWAQLMSEMLLELLKQAKIDINQNIKNRVFIEKQYDIIISDGKKEEPPPQKSGKRGKYKRSKGLNLLERLEKHKESVLAYAFDPIIPFTNNLAERDLRPSKIKMKVSNTFRSIEGANHHARLAGFTSTLRKQNINVFSTIMDVFDGKEITFAQ